jgi:hypothetical protein
MYIRIQLNVYMARSAYIPLYIIEKNSCTFHEKLPKKVQYFRQILFYYKDFSSILGPY